MMKRIIMHWTAGGTKASETDIKHYHEIVQGDGSRVLGRHKPEANLNPRTGQYAAHTRGANTGAVGLAMAAMLGATDRPLNPGRSQIGATQLAVFVAMTAEYCDTYNIPVERETVLTHAEVQPTLGIAQRGKWDIRWLPGMDYVGDAVVVGDAIRAMVRKELDLLQGPPVATGWLGALLALIASFGRKPK